MIYLFAVVCSLFALRYVVGLIRKRALPPVASGEPPYDFCCGDKEHRDANH